MLFSCSLVVLGGALAGGFVSGLAGFGSGLVALALWLYVLEPATAATLIVLCSVVSQSQTIATVWHAIDRARVWPMLVAGLAGIPIGTGLLAYLDPRVLSVGTGFLLLAFSIFMLVGRYRRRFAWGGRAADCIVGLAGGVLGGLAGLSGVLPTIWATLRGWSKDERRGLFQAYNLVVLSGALAWHASSGLLTAQILHLAPIALPGTVVGAWLGARAYRRLSDQHFHELVLALLGVSGLTLVFTRL